MHVTLGVLSDNRWVLLVRRRSLQTANRHEDDAYEEQDREDGYDTDTARSRKQRTERGIEAREESKRRGRNDYSNDDRGEETGSAENRVAWICRIGSCQDAREVEVRTNERTNERRTKCEKVVESGRRRETRLDDEVQKMQS